MVEKKQEEEKIKEKWVVMEVPDTMKEAIVNQEKKEVHTQLTILASIKNDLEIIKKSLV